MSDIQLNNWDDLTSYIFDESPNHITYKFDHNAPQINEDVRIRLLEMFEEVELTMTRENGTVVRYIKCIKKI